jgi:hypothetical protein
MKNINYKFIDFFSDIIVLCVDDKKIDLFYKKHTNKINNDLFFNQNYLDKNSLSHNLYDWNNICLFIHHDLLNPNTYNSLKMRCERFNMVLNKYNNSTALLFITKIVSENIVNYINKIIEIKNTNNINCYIIVIINHDTLVNSHTFDENNKCLFIIRKVENYETQKLKYGVDNSSGYQDEYKIILNYFEFYLIEKNNI